MVKQKYTHDASLLIDTVNDAYKEMLETKARLGQCVITTDEKGEACRMRAADVYEHLFGKLPSIDCNHPK